MKAALTDSLRILIVDDEEDARDNLLYIAQRHTTCNVNIVGMASDTRSAERFIQTAAPHLVFLDIHMPNENAFEFLQRFGHHSFEIVFVTAYDEYALKAFKLNAVDYILKPLDHDEIFSAIDKVRHRLLQHQILQKDNTLYSKLLAQVYAKTATEQFTFKSNGVVNVIALRDVVFIEAIGSYARVHYMADSKLKSFIMSHSLSEYEELLPADLFYRTHKSFLVNRLHVVNIIRSDNPVLVLCNKKELPIGRRRLADFMQFLNGKHT